MRRVTLADVASNVGVSAKTVSNVVNQTGWVSDEVRDRIQQAIRELGYRPNMAARQLRGGSSGLLALVLPDLREPYFAEFAAEFVSAADKKSVTVLVAQTGGDRDRERALIEAEDLPALDGIVMSALSLTASDLDDRRSQTPLILIGEHGTTLVRAGVPHIGIDNVAAAAAATRYLLDRGRRRIAAIGVQTEGSTATSRMRFEGYQRALEEAGIPLDDSLLGRVSAFNRAEGSHAAQRLIDESIDFDGLFCFNDSLAFGALYSLGVHGMRVPVDVDVIGFDDIEEGRFSIPPFATIDPGVSIVAKEILDVLDGSSNLDGGLRVLPFNLVER
jgi:DNA-binding LacI/PurR family transcriptional regulator